MADVEKQSQTADPHPERSVVANVVHEWKQPQQERIAVILNPPYAQAYSDQFSHQNQLSAHWISSHLPSQQIQQISELAKDVFGDEDVAQEWLLEPNLATDGEPPIDLLGSAEGYARVHTLLKRIEYGVLA